MNHEMLKVLIVDDEELALKRVETRSFLLMGFNRKLETPRLMHWWA